MKPGALCSMDQGDVDVHQEPGGPQSFICTNIRGRRCYKQDRIAKQWRSNIKDDDGCCAVLAVIDIFHAS